MIFGITEAGDASVDYSWIRKVNDTDFTVLITKNITNKFINEALKVKDKVVIHATCTGYGGTTLEPNVPKWEAQLEQFKKLINNGFPENQLIVRIDPIIPTKKGLVLVQTVVEGFSPFCKTFRISVLDNYKHVQQRFVNAGLPVLYAGSFRAPDCSFSDLDKLLKKCSELYGVEFECCAEPKLKNAKQVGCISFNDLERLNLKYDKECFGFNNRRKGCLCLSGKKELLEHKSYSYNGIKYGCSNCCLYCYWRS